MYLKSLKVTGFKSFADRTRLEFRPGVTVVVGPNGSGKSNLVDALSWVLGTQSTKALRTPRMEDVIFAGTATRPSLGRAEATLVIDNEERQIDLDLDEVSITRRLYRDGSSDYELNGVGCRLLDIQDLLSDSGVGRHQHVIIGQGEIGRVLNASPEEHRAVIEESAGILKHQRRKERSERRLERTDEDMVRLQDLLGEIKRQMRPLRRQARAAERYEGLKAEVTALRLYLGGRQLAELDRELTIAVSEKSTLSERLQIDQERVQQLSSRLTGLTDSVGTVAAHLDRDTTAAGLVETTIERLRRISSIARERGRALSGRREAVVERRVDLEEELASIAGELGEVEAERRKAERMANSAEGAFRRLDDEESAIATQNSLSPEGALAAVRGELSGRESALTRDRREIEKLAHRIDVLGGQIDEEQREIERINVEVQTLDSSIGDLQREYEVASRGRTETQGRWSKAEEALDKARIDLASANARVEAVSSALEGRYDVRARRSVESASGALGALVSQLDIPQGLETAVIAALGEWAEAVAFDNEASVRHAVETVKGFGGGSVAVVSSMSETASPAIEVAEGLGIEALVHKLGPNHHPGLASRLLGDVVLVEGWSAGWQLIARHPAIRAVTPEGDLISVSGVRMADPDGVGSAMLETAEVAAEQAATELARAVSIHTAAKRDFEKSRGTERNCLESLERAEGSLAGLSEAMNRLQASVRGLVEERSRLEDRRSSVQAAIADGDGHIETLQTRLSSMEGEQADRLAAWEAMEATRVSVVADREVARSQWQEAAAALGAVVERERLLEERGHRVRDELNDLDLGLVSHDDPGRLRQIGDLSRAGVGILESRLAELRDRQAELRDRHAGLRQELESVTAEHQESSDRISEARARLSEIDIKLMELRLRRDSVAEAIRRDADAEVEDAMQAPRPELPEDGDVEEIMEDRLTQLRRLGPINPLAAEEYRDLEGRHSFLSEQMADVETSRAELRKVISALEAEIQTRFDIAFSEIAAAYEKYFKALFPGGRGRIRLADPDDPRSGVVIDAQPLGKRVSQMTLLSGGERSLAALAFLFAIFEARPSPFYVLDEVEAALDDANLRRFLRIVDEFKQRAQLIIVTHQQQTMGAADVLYGVTIEPGGSSQAVRKDMRAVLASDHVAQPPLE